MVWLSSVASILSKRARARLMLGLERVEPVAGRAALELDEQLAPEIGGDADRRAGDGGRGQQTGLVAGPGEGGAAAAAAPVAGRGRWGAGLRGHICLLFHHLRQPPETAPVPAPKLHSPRLCFMLSLGLQTGVGFQGEAPDGRRLHLLCAREPAAGAPACRSGDRARLQRLVGRRAAAAPSYGDVITEKIGEAKAAIVVWSEDAAASEWVRAEADVAAQPEEADPDLDRRPHAADAVQPDPVRLDRRLAWRGRSSGLDKVKASLAALCGAPGTPAPAPTVRPVTAAPVAPAPAARTKLFVPGLIGALALAALAAFYFLWPHSPDDSGTRTNQVAAASAAPQPAAAQAAQTPLAATDGTSPRRRRSATQRPPPICVAGRRGRRSRSDGSRAATSSRPSHSRAIGGGCARLMARSATCPMGKSATWSTAEPSRPATVAPAPAPVRRISPGRARRRPSSRRRRHLRSRSDRAIPAARCRSRFRTCAASATAAQGRARRNASSSTSEWRRASGPCRAAIDRAWKEWLPGTDSNHRPTG